MYVSYYLPLNTLNNDELEQLYNNPSWTAKKIFRKTGINERHVAAQHETVSDMACNAAKRLFGEYRISPDSIDFILLCTQSPDYFLPSTSCIIQNRLGIPTTAGALDFNLGCSGYIYGLSVAKGLISAEIAGNILLLTADLYTRHIHPFDRSTRTIFGDAATATLITKDDLPNIGEFVLGTDGGGYQNLIIPSGGMVLHTSEETSAPMTDESGNIRSKDNLYMNGPEIYAFTLRTVPALVESALQKNALCKDEIDYFILHQANSFMLESLRDKLDIPQEKFCIDMSDTGNTVSSTIPLAIKRSQATGYLSQAAAKQKILIAGFGVGYSWGATILTI